MQHGGMIRITLRLCQPPVSTAPVCRTKVQRGMALERRSWRELRAEPTRHDRASELDSWDCVDELVAEEDYSQEWGEAASR